MTTDSTLGHWYSVPGLLALVLVCAGAVGMEAASPKASPLRSAEQTSLAPADTQHIALEEGWNLISSRLVPDDPSMESVFAPIADAVEVVRDPSGAVYRPSDGTNTIGDWDVQKGYEVYVTSPQTLVIEGRLPVSNEADIPLEEGWNTVSYLPNTPQSLTEALAAIEGALSMVKDETGSVFVPDEGINQLEQLAPGEGFKMHVSTSQTLSYPDSPLSSDLEYPTACLDKPGSVPVGEYGTLTPGAAADSTQRAANLTAINTAIDEAPAGGAVCLPGGTGTSQDSLYLTWNYDPGKNNDWGGGHGHIALNRDSVSVIGAGACGWGNMDGCTYIETVGDEYYYHDDLDGDGDLDFIRGVGITMEPRGYGSGDPVDDVTMKGFQLNGGTDGWTGCYSFNYDQDIKDEDCWDLTHKAIFFGGDNDTDNILIEDVQLDDYKGEVIYNGGFGAGDITIRRVWSHDSNGSAYNIAQAENQLVEDSKFGPNVRFWGELQAEGVPNATAIFKQNEYVDCDTGNGCLAIAADTESNYVEGMSWTWKNNTFDIDPANTTKNHFLLEDGPYSLTIKDNTFNGGQIWIANGGAGSEVPTVNVSGNNHNAEGAHPFYMQSADLQGTISDNTFSNVQSIYKAVGGNLSGLSIENNTFDGAIGLSGGGGGPSVYALILNNTYLNSELPRTTIYSYTDKTVGPYTEKHQIRGGSGGSYNAKLGVKASDGQRATIFGGMGTITLPADSSAHTWTNDITLSSSSDSVQVEFDRPNETWSIVE